MATPAFTIEPPVQLPALILAGGQGNGLFPLTLARPKPCLAFGPSRIIDFTLSNCRNSGLKDCVLLTQYGRDQLAVHIRRNWNRGFRCVSAALGKRYRGTADAVYQNLLLLQGAQHVLILAGDHVYQMDYRKLIRRHLEADADLTLSTVEFPLKQASSFGVLELGSDFNVCRFVEKPVAPRPVPHRPAAALVSMGIYVFRVEALIDALHRYCYAASGFDFGHHIIPAMIESGKVFACEFRDETTGNPCYWRDAGTIDSYYNASMDLLRVVPPPFDLWSGFVPRDASLPPATVVPSARVSHTMLCDGVEVGDAAEIAECVLMPGSKVGRGARLRRVIVDEGVQIPEGFTAGWDAEVDRLDHIVSPGGVVVVSHAPQPARVHVKREQTVMQGRRESSTPIARPRRESA
jgi:glucose-1-phosphate adenylyltransferase